MKIHDTIALAAMVALFTFNLSGLSVAYAATVVNLGTTDGFAVLGGSTISNTGSSVINGDLGLSPGTSVTGFPPGTINGAQHVANANAVQAQTDLTSAYTNAAGQTPVSTIPTELGGTTLTSGSYDSAAGTFGLTGTLTLDAEGDANAVFIFKTASTLITAGASTIVLTNGAQACNVFWQVGSSATLGANSVFKGNILALTSITLTTGANVEGRVLARNGAVTLDSNTVSTASCAVVTPPPAAEPEPEVVSEPEPVITATSTPVTAPVVTSTPTPTPEPVVVVAPVEEVAPVPTTTPVVVPKLPATGLSPDEKGTLWKATVPAGVIAGILLFYALRRKQLLS